MNIVRSYKKFSEGNKKRNISNPVPVPQNEVSKTFPAKPVMEMESRNGSETVPAKPEFQPSVSSFSFEEESLERLDSLETVAARNEKQHADTRIYADEPNSKTENKISKSSSVDLQLDTPENVKRAFVHSLIFDRKY